MNQKFNRSDGNESAAFGNREYPKIRRWLKDKTGVELGSSKHSLVEIRLYKRVVELECSSLSEYVDLLDNLSSSTHPEWQVFIDILTTHETYFYREAVHFDFLKQIILPKYRDKGLKILSAACSSGEEVYTLAFEVNEFFKCNANWHVYGTDIAEGPVLTAKRGIYSVHRTKLIPEVIRKKYLQETLSENTPASKVTQEIKQNISLYRSNLLSQIEFSPFDVIFCRNLLIYFDKPTKHYLITKLLDSLNPGGYLIVSQFEYLGSYVPEEYLINSSIVRKPTYEC